MMNTFVRYFVICVVVVSFSSCHSDGSNRENVQDTAVRTTSDTAVIPGTPGPSGTEPRLGDSTKAGKDSLNPAANNSDSSGRPATKP